MGQRIRFYTDEQVARAVARGLRQRGVDVLTVPEAGMMGASDREHLERARAEGRVLSSPRTMTSCVCISHTRRM